MIHAPARLLSIVCLVSLFAGVGCPKEDDTDESLDAAVLTDARSGGDAHDASDTPSDDLDAGSDADAADAETDGGDRLDAADISPDAPEDPCANPTSPSAIPGVDLSTAIIVGRPARPASERPTEPTIVHSFEAYRTTFSYDGDASGRADGELTTDGSATFTPTGENPLAWSVFLFFENGGQAAVIVPSAADLPTEAELSQLTSLETGGLLVVPALSAAQPELARQTGFTRVASALDAPGNEDLFFIGDLPASLSAAQVDGATSPAPLDFHHERAALYHPWLTVNSAVDDTQLASVPPAGAVAGVIARTDRERGIWQTPAGPGANLRAVLGLAQDFSTTESDVLNQNEINSLRVFQGQPLVWGGRTRQVAAPEWKYVAPRRLGMYVEESIYRGTDWAAFQPNEAGLWSTLQAESDAFLLDLWRQGGLQGDTANQAFFATVDETTTSSADIAAGHAVILVGIATVVPAEFSVLRIERPAGHCSE